MAEYYTGQIMMTAFIFAQKNFAMCNGQLLSIQQNQALFALIGANYGGNGSTNFALPELRGRTPVGQGQAIGAGNYAIGMSGGAEQVTLTAAEMPQHNHLFAGATRAGSLGTPTATPGIYATATTTTGGTENIYALPNTGTLTPLLPAAISTVGGNQPHPNMQPFRVINFNIALSGQFPSRN